MASPGEPIGLQQLDNILAFLPIFERPGYSFGEWRTQRGVFPFWESSPEAIAFVQALYQEQFIISFNWGDWTDEAKHYTEGGWAALVDADLLTLRKLLTTYVRADRFSEGTLASVFQSGQITAVLRRLRQIRERLLASPIQDG